MSKILAIGLLIESLFEVSYAEFEMIDVEEGIELGF